MLWVLFRATRCENRKSEAGILHVPLFPDILLLRAEIWGIRTLKGAVLCDIGGHSEEAGIREQSNLTVSMRERERKELLSCLLAWE